MRGASAVPVLPQTVTPGALKISSLLTDFPEEMLEEDRQGLRDVGFSERDIWDIAAVAGFFNMTNRVAAATDMRPNPEYHGQARA